MSALPSAGDWMIKDSGYIAFNIKGISKTGERFADVSTLKLSGNAIDQKIAFVKNNEGNFFHWGSRGPSVHLNYASPENTDIEWFYNEVTVPEGEDIIGSYFMANGFAEGYFGIRLTRQQIGNLPLNKGYNFVLLDVPNGTTGTLYVQTTPPSVQNSRFT